MQGEGINFSDLQKSPVYPLIEGKSAKKASDSEDSARYIRNGMLSNLLRFLTKLSDEFSGCYC